MTLSISERISALSSLKREFLRLQLGASSASLRLVAYLEVAGLAPDDEELIEHMGKRLPPHMVPSVFVVLDEFSRLPNAKVDRIALPEPERVAAEAFGDHEPPRTPVEETIARVWAEALELDQISRNDDFFDLGGHSILATHTIAKLSRELGVPLRLRVLFESPTVAGVAEHVEALLTSAGDGGGDNKERQEFEI